MGTTRKVEKLLLELFSPEEVRLLVRHLPSGKQVSMEVPEVGCTPAQLVHRVVALLERRGELDQAFFVAVLQARPAQRRSILTVARGFLGPEFGHRRQGGGSGRPGHQSQQPDVVEQFLGNLGRSFADQLLGGGAKKLGETLADRLVDRILNPPEEGWDEDERPARVVVLKEILNDYADYQRLRALLRDEGVAPPRKKAECAETLVDLIDDDYDLLDSALLTKDLAKLLRDIDVEVPSRKDERIAVLVQILDDGCE